MSIYIAKFGIFLFWTMNILLILFIWRLCICNEQVYSSFRSIYHLFSLNKSTIVCRAIILFLNYVPLSFKKTFQLKTRLKITSQNILSYYHSIKWLSPTAVIYNIKLGSTIKRIIEISLWISVNINPWNNFLTNQKKYRINKFVNLWT